MEVLPLTLKSPNDPKAYRLCTLPNGLQALLVHDPEIGKQQAAPGHAEEPTEEDMDDLLSGDESEVCHRRLRRAVGACTGSAAANC